MSSTKRSWVKSFLLFITLFTIACKPIKPAGTYFPEWQKKKFNWPAMVLYVQEAYKNDSTAIEQFEFLEATEKISLSNGYLILQHFSGKLYEYAGDTSLIAWEAVELHESDHYLPPEDLKFLFNKTRFNYYYRDTHIFHEDHSDYAFLYPYSRTTYLNPNQNICLWWKPRFAHSDPFVTLSFKTIYDEEVYHLETDNRLIEIPQPLNIEGNLLIIDLISQGEGQNQIAFKIGDTETEITPCSATKSIDLLHIGTVMERELNFEEAYEFYTLAAAASDHPVFEEIRLNAFHRLLNQQEP